MKSASSICKVMVLATAVLVSASLWAASKGSLGLQHPTNVAGKTLSAGNYTVRWEGTGDQVDLKVYQGRSVVASIPARVIQLKAPAPYDSAVVNNESDGHSSLAEIRFGGKKFALQISNEGAAAGSSGASK